MKYFGRLSSEGMYQKIEKNLKELGVIYEVKAKASGWRTFRFLESEIPKLPQDGPGPYLPIEPECGYSFWEITDEEWNEK